MNERTSRRLRGAVSLGLVAAAALAIVGSMLGWPLLQTTVAILGAVGGAILGTLLTIALENRKRGPR